MIAAWGFQLEHTAGKGSADSADAMCQKLSKRNGTEMDTLQIRGRLQCPWSLFSTLVETKVKLSSSIQVKPAWDLKLLSEVSFNAI